MHHVTRAEPIDKQPEREWKKYQLSANWTMVGYSRAADRTFFHIPELKIGLDAGGTRGRQPENTFITHTHIDHSIDAWYIARNSGSTIFVPESSIEFVKNSVRALWELNLSARIDEEIKLNIIPVKHDDKFNWGKGDMYTVRVFNCFHKVPCLGYAFSEKRTKLKEEYKGLKGEQIRDLKKQGVEITHTFEEPMFAYVGDTSTQVFESSPWLFDFPIIITECTFLRDEQEKAAEDGHTHWDHLLPYVLAHPKVKFILIHFSLRYKSGEIFEFFDNVKQQGTNIDNVVIFVGDGSAGKV